MLPRVARAIEYETVLPVATVFELAWQLVHCASFDHDHPPAAASTRDRSNFLHP